MRLKFNFTIPAILAVLALTISLGCVPYSVFSREVLNDKEMMVSGVWFEGATVVDPRPVTSKYFRVFQGGFKTSRRGARYWLLTDIIKEVPNDLWVEVKCENPMDSRKPIVEGGPVKAGAKSFYYDGTGHLLGLKMFETYRVKVVLYDSNDKKEVLDQFTQKIKSYVDTQSDKVLIAKSLTQK